MAHEFNNNLKNIANQLLVQQPMTQEEYGYNSLNKKELLKKINKEKYKIYSRYLPDKIVMILMITNRFPSNNEKRNRGKGFKSQDIDSRNHFIK